MIQDEVGSKQCLSFAAAPSPAMAAVCDVELPSDDTASTGALHGCGSGLWSPFPSSNGGADIGRQ